jgi:hypothetical protein
MTTTKDNNGKPIGYLATLTSDKEVITVNATEYVTTVVTRDRRTGEVKTETFYGKNPLVTRG